MANLGGLGFSQIAVLAPEHSSDNWPVQFGAMSATKSFGERGEDKNVLWLVLHDGLIQKRWLTYYVHVLRDVQKIMTEAKQFQYVQIDGYNSHIPERAGRLLMLTVRKKFVLNTPTTSPDRSWKR